MKTGARVLEEVGSEKCNDDREVSQEAVGQEDLTEPAGRLGDGKGFAEIGAGCGERDGRDLTAGELDERATEEVADADAERGKGKTGHVLVRAKRNRQQAVNQAHEERACQRAEHRNTDGGQRAHFGCGNGLLIEERANNAADTADIHHARNTEVQVAGFFGEDLTGAAVEKGNALHDGARKERSKIKHLLRLLFARAQTDLIGEEELTADDEE